MSLTQDLKWLLEQSSALQVSFSTASNWFVTLYFPQWDMPKNMAVSNLAFCYTLYLCEFHIQGRTAP